MVNWTAEKDQQLLKGVFQFCDIKMSAPLLQHLAEIIGEGCTPKAVTHRLSNIKNTGKPIKDPNATPSKNAGVSARSTPAKTPGSRGRGKKAAAEGEDDEPSNELESPTKGKKRGRPAEGAEEANKKIKKEELDAVFWDAPLEVEDALDEI